MKLIDADALHKAYMELRNFKQDPQSGDWISLRAVPLTTVIRMLNEAPTIEPKRGEWIPCSEKLPSKDGRYLVTFPTLINRPWIDILWYGRPTFPETDHPCFYASDDEYGDVEYDDVVAWMPLPEPYGEREGE